MNKFKVSSFVLLLSVVIFNVAFALEQRREYISSAQLERPLEVIPSVIETADFIFTIDGGGSKTELQVLNKYGTILPLFFNNSTEPVYARLGAGSNINRVGVEAVANVFADLFHDLKIGYDKLGFPEIVSSSAIVAGIAGLGTNNNDAKINSILQDLNFSDSQQALFSDGALSLGLAKDEGAILISGTGCICMAKHANNAVKRAAGYGQPSVSKCGGYFFGKMVLDYVTEDESGYGDPTLLTAAIRKKFSIPHETSIIEFFRARDFTDTEIASISPLVFEQAYDFDDFVALKIINQATDFSARILAYSLSESKNLSFKVYLIGGLFRSEHVDKYIKNIETQPALEGFEIEWVNMSREKIFPLIVQEILGEMHVDRDNMCLLY